MHGPGGAARPAAAPAPDDDVPGRTSASRTGARSWTSAACGRATSSRLEDVRRLPFTDETRAERHLAVRRVRAAARGGRARPLLHERVGRAGRPRLLARRHQHVDRADRPSRRGRRRAPRRPRPHGLPLRHVHQRLGHALRHGAARRDHHPRRRRADRAPRPDDADLRRDRPGLHAVLRPVPRGAGRGARRGPRVSQAAARPLRQRAVLRRHEGRDRGEARPPRPRQLRPLQGARPRHRRRVRLRLRPARQRGPPAPRGDRPRDRRAAWSTASRASWSSRR